MDPLASKKPITTKNNPAAFLGENSALVNLDNLIKPVNSTSNNNAYNPFSDSPAMKKNLFQQNQPQVAMVQTFYRNHRVTNHIVVSFF
jgi:epsin